MLEIAAKDIAKRLSFDNPWWEEGLSTNIRYSNNPRRKYFDPFFNAIVQTSIRRAVVLMGPRRVGKTVMVYHAIRRLLDEGIDPKAILFLSLETPIYTGLSLDKLVSLFQERFEHSNNSPLFIFFDEIQYLKDWEIHLKSLVDSFPEYKFIATGSAAAALRMKSNESGAGRFSNFVLPPLTFAEYLSFIGKEDLIKPGEGDDISRFVTTDINDLNEEFVNYLNYGGYPEAVFSEEIRSNPGQYIKSDIIDKVLLRDLPSLYGINDIQELNRLFTTLAYNSGNEVSLEGLSQSSGVVKNTIKRYLEYLEAAFLIKRVERVDNNAKRFKRAMNFKVYLTNPSMRAALFGQIDAESDEMGALTETAIFSQWQHSSSANLFYARWTGGEVDIVCLGDVDQKPQWIVEVKWSDRPYRNNSELDNCVEFATKHNLHKVSWAWHIVVTSRTIEAEITYRNIPFRFIPSSLYAYMLGANILNQLDLHLAKNNR